MEGTEEVRNRKEEEVKKEETQEEEDKLPDGYDIEKDPEYKYIFVIVKMVIVCLGYLCFHLFFNTVIRPLFISVDERIGMVVAALQEQWCQNGVCTGEDEKTIEAIVKNIKESGRRFW
ncbi:hypothetical protein WA577_004677 [Blastocystis sp. JDR]